MARDLRSGMTSKASYYDFIGATPRVHVRLRAEFVEAFSLAPLDDEVEALASFLPYKHAPFALYRSYLLPSEPFVCLVDKSVEG